MSCSVLFFEGGLWESPLPVGTRILVDPYKLKGDLTEKSNVFYIDVGVPWDVLGGSESLPWPSVKIRCRAYYHFKEGVRLAASGPNRLPDCETHLYGFLPH